MNKRTFNNWRAFFFACLLPLLVADLVITLIMYHYSVDRGLWPVFLSLMVCVSFLYSGLAYVVAEMTQNLSTAMALQHQILFATVLVVFELIFWLAAPEWLAVNDGEVQLTLFQRVLYGHWTLWAIYPFFYVTLIFRISLRQHQR